MTESTNGITSDPETQGADFATTVAASVGRTVVGQQVVVNHTLCWQIHYTA